MWLVAVLASLSLFFFNRQSRLDATALYFFGSYALGMFAFWMSGMVSAVRGRWLLCVAVLGAIALAFDFRGRIALALAVAWALVWLQTHGQVVHGRPDLWPRWLKQIGLMSYSIFLIHFPVCLLVNAVVSHFWPGQLLASVLGLLGAFALSLLAGAALYRSVEARGLHAPTRPVAALGG